MRRAWLVPLLLSITACAGSRDMQDSASTGLTSGGEDTDDSDGSGGGTTGESLDVGDGMGSAGDGDGDKGCKGIDFLFVVDNSGSMKDEQENLTASFPGFVSAIEDKVAEFDAADFHILVADTDSIRVEAPGPYCSLACDGTTDTCQSESGADVPCEFSEDYGCYTTCKADMNASCGAQSCEELLGCDGCGCDLGAGKTVDMDGNPCNVAGGERFIQMGQPDLPGTFACLAEVGTQGSGDERQAGALVDALEATNPGDCNAGFLRDDAILVVTLITDEDEANQDAGSPGTPAEWKSKVVAAKNGDEEAMVVLGLIGDGGQPGAVCEYAENGAGSFAPTLHELVTSFPRHVVGSVCEPNYATFFEEAVDIIKTTCESYVPPQG